MRLYLQWTILSAPVLVTWPYQVLCQNLYGRFLGGSVITSSVDGCDWSDSTLYAASAESAHWLTHIEIGTSSDRLASIRDIAWMTGARISLMSFLGRVYWTSAQQSILTNTACQLQGQLKPISEGPYGSSKPHCVHVYVRLCMCKYMSCWTPCGICGYSGRGISVSTRAVQVKDRGGCATMRRWPWTILAN